MTDYTDNEQQVVLGVVERITYHNPENGYCVLKVAVADRREELTVVGFTGPIHIGSSIAARGRFCRHPKYGQQLEATQITETAPTTPAGLQRYLASGVVKGVGPKTAEALVEAFGNEVLEVIHRDPQRVAAVTGVGQRRAKLLSQAFNNQENRAEIERFLLEHNIGSSLAHKIINTYGLDTIEQISKNPYQLAHDINGVGFSTADSIALGLGFAPDSPPRLKAGLFWALDRAADDGHCFLPADQLRSRACQLLGLEENYDFTPQLEELFTDKYLIQRGDRLYLRRLADAEEVVTRFVATRCDSLTEPLMSPAAVATALTSAAGELNVKFSSEQEQAVADAANFQLLLITGGPGCGKTTVIRALAHLFRNSNHTLALAAPTGKAAQRMSEVCGLPAKTIHRLLRYDPIHQCFQCNANQPIHADEDPNREVDAVIIDEASMIDIQLAASLMAAMPRKAVLILVGDKDQLPSVGPGRVFSELLSLPEIRCVVLSQLFRRSEESHITTIAHTINAGIVPEIPEPDGETRSDAYFIPRRDPSEIATLVESLVAEQIPRKFGFQLDQILVLTPTNRGPLGTVELNRRLQNRLNPAGDSPSVIVGHTELRINDKVCQRRNNYNIDEYGVFNGDIGRVHSIDPKDQELIVDLWDGRLIRYDRSSLRELSLAYTLTVHRSQGSEIPCVILVLHDSQYILLERQLLYTGITRAKQLLIIVGSRRALALATKRVTARRRFTSLAERITQAL